jgi:hypothetical protein
MSDQKQRRPNHGTVWLRSDPNGTGPIAKGYYRQGSAEHDRFVTVWPTDDLRKFWPDIAKLAQEQGVDIDKLQMNFSTDSVAYTDQSAMAACKRDVLAYLNDATPDDVAENKYVAGLTYLETADPVWLADEASAYGWKPVAYEAA